MGGFLRNDHKTANMPSPLELAAWQRRRSTGIDHTVAGGWAFALGGGPDRRHDEVQARVAARRDAKGPTKCDQTGTGVDRAKRGAQTVRHPGVETAVVLKYFARFETASRCEMTLGVSGGARASRPC
jgi:hypothetical protein